MRQKKSEFGQTGIVYTGGQCISATDSRPEGKMNEEFIHVDRNLKGKLHLA